jgi:hypothetical protein
MRVVVAQRNKTLLTGQRSHTDACRRLLLRPMRRYMECL